MANPAASRVRVHPALARAVREGRYLVSPRVLAEALLRSALFGRDAAGPRPPRHPITGRRPGRPRGP